MFSLTVFGERLSERMFELKISSKEFAKRLNVSISTVNDWKRGKFLIVLGNLLKAADELKCSVDFLAGRTEAVLDFIPCEPVPFYPHFCAVLQKCGITKYRLVKEKILGKNTVYAWKSGIEPQILTLYKLADHLGITIDYLVGREK